MFNQNPMGCPPFGQPQMQQFGRNFNQFVPSTNKQFVRSLEEALSLPAGFNSQNVYFDTDKNIIYDICTNGQGEKSWAIFTVVPQQTGPTKNNQQVPDAIEERFKRLENKLEEVLNGKCNAQPANATNASSN
jgi:hypothetical protein